jgi:peptidoglycan/LPS O-acetylase OafA/YrhL
MRALAALLVFLNHAYAQAYDPVKEQHATGIFAPLEYVMVVGHLSVTIFIVISGFCLALPVLAASGELPGGALAFMKKRARRILPPYYGAVALCLALIWTIIGSKTGTVWDFPIQVKEPQFTKVALISHLLLVQDVVATSKINYVFWSIAVEWHLYFFFPLIVWAYKKLGPNVTVIAAFVLGYALRLAVDDTRLERACPHYLGLFVLGMFAADVTYGPRGRNTAIRDRFPWGWLAGAAVVCLAALIASWGIDLSKERYFLLDLPAAAIALSGLVLSSRSEKETLHRLFVWRPLAFVGMISYSLYLIHAPLLQIGYKFVLYPLGASPTVQFVFFMSAGLVFVLGASYLFFRVFERPFITAPNQRGEPRREAAVMPVS